MAWTTINATQVDQDSPIDEALMEALKADLDQLKANFEKEHTWDDADSDLAVHDKALGQDLDLGANKIVNLAAGTDGTDAVRGDRATSSTDGSISGVGDFTTDRDIEVVDNTNIQKTIISKDGTPVGTRQEINIITPVRAVLVVADDAGNDRVNITLTPDSQVANVGEAISGLWLPTQSDRLVGTPQFLTTTPATISTVSASRTAWQAFITVTHVGIESDGDEGFDLFAVPNAGSAADANKLWTRTALPTRVRPGETKTISLQFALEAGGTIEARSESTSTKLAVRCTIWETTDTTLIVAAPAILTTSYATLLTVTNPTGAVSVLLHNYGSVEAGAAVAFRPTGAGSDNDAYNVSSYQAGLLQPGELRSLVFPHTLAAGDLVRLRASAGTTISARVSALEIA